VCVCVCVCVRVCACVCVCVRVCACVWMGGGVGLCSPFFEWLRTPWFHCGCIVCVARLVGVCVGCVRGVCALGQAGADTPLPGALPPATPDPATPAHVSVAASDARLSRDAAQDADLLRVFQCWVVSLKSPSVSLKEHGFRRLSDIIECVCQLWQVWTWASLGQPGPPTLRVPLGAVLLPPIMPHDCAARAATLHAFALAWSPTPSTAPRPFHAIYPYSCRAEAQCARVRAGVVRIPAGSAGGAGGGHGHAAAGPREGERAAVLPVPSGAWAISVTAHSCAAAVAAAAVIAAYARSCCCSCCYCCYS
jgi:hypothetical protein